MIDLFAGLGGWAEGGLAENYRVIGFDIEQHVYGEHRYPAQLVIQDVLTLHGSQFRNADLIVASPPCQEYSYMAMPWSRAKAKAAAIRADETGKMLADLTRLFDACFRIQAQASMAAGRYVPLIVENVKGAQPWVGRARWNFGSFYLWGDIPALMPATSRAQKFNPDESQNVGSWFAIADSKNRGTKVAGMNWSRFGELGYRAEAFNGNAERAFKNTGGSWFNIGSPGQKVLNQNPVHSGIKQHGSGREWFAGDGKISRMTSSKSPARKAASAMIAKIPLPLARHIARTFHP